MREKDATAKKGTNMKANLKGNLIRIALFAVLFGACLALAFTVLPK